MVNRFAPNTNNQNVVG